MFNGCFVKCYTASLKSAFLLLYNFNKISWEKTESCEAKQFCVEDELYRRM